MRLSLVVATVVVAGPFAHAAHAQPSARRVQQVADSFLVDLHQRGLFNGAVVLGRGADEIYARGFGPANVALNVPFTPDTPADGGSIAKTLTAASVLMLEREGRLRLDDRVQQYVAEYPHRDTRIRHLLTHSAGLPEKEYDFFESLVPTDRVRTTALLLGVLRAHNVVPDFPPGTRFQYSSLGFDVAALLVERVTGQSWETFLRARVFAPLGFEHTFLRPPRLADWRGPRTLSYRRSGDSLALHDVFDNEGFYGGSNLYFSARDLHRWSRSFYTKPVLDARTLARGYRADSLHDPRTRFGGRSALNLLSWYYEPNARQYHYPGALQGFWGSVYRDEARGHSVVYLSNNSMPQWLRPLLSRALIAILDGRSPEPVAAPRYAKLPESLSRGAGRYRVDRVGMVDVTVRDGRAFIRIERGIEYPAFSVGDGQLYVPGLDVWIGFSPDAAVAESPFRQLTWSSIFVVGNGVRQP